MFDVANKEKPDLAALKPAFGFLSGEGRLAGVNRFRQEMEVEADLHDKERNKIKHEMREFRNLHKEAAALDEHYMECFPTYNEDDFQFSVKDNLSKRPPNLGNKSFSHRR